MTPSASPGIYWREHKPVSVKLA